MCADPTTGDPNPKLVGGMPAAMNVDQNVQITATESNGPTIDMTNVRYHFRVFDTAGQPTAIVTLTWDNNVFNAWATRNLSGSALAPDAGASEIYLVTVNSAGRVIPAGTDGTAIVSIKAKTAGKAQIQFGVVSDTYREDIMTNQFITVV